MGDSRQKMRAAWLAVADACERACQADIWEDVGPFIVAAVGAPSSALRSWPDLAAAIRAMCGPDEDEAPPADVSLLALANRTLTADLEAARAEVSERTAERDEARTIADRNINFRAKLWEAIGGHIASDPLEPLSEGAARVRRERDEARDEVARLTRERAVERGDQAPAGWAWADGAWVGPGLVRLVRRDSGEWAWWDGRTVRTWPTALEAMEAVDAERGGVPNG